MKTYQFKVTLQGTGNNSGQAWDNAVKAFKQDPGNGDDCEQLIRCNNCMIEYEEIELKEIAEDNEHDPQDKSLYFIKACPKCKTDAYLTDEWVDL